MPHVNIRYFPVPLTPDAEASLLAAVTSAVRDAFGVDEGVISIALEPVEPDAWDDTVYQPEIVGRRDLLRKTPTY